MPILRPESPRFVNGSEKAVWDALCAQLGPSDVLLSGLRFSNRAKDYEADAVVLIPGYGVIVLEVKGGSVWRADGEWMQRRGSRDVRINPAEQARACKYALRAYIESDPRWTTDRRRVRWNHAVVLPNTDLGADFSSPDCPRWMVSDRGDLTDLGDRLRDMLRQNETANRELDHDDVQVIREILAGRGRSHFDLVAAAHERDDEAQRLTEAQAMILGAIRYLPRVEIRGGAGSGKTWLAVEQAKRLTASGQRVALLCYSRGLAAFLRRVIEPVQRKHQPAYVGEFHGLGRLWGAAVETEQDSDYWEHRLPAQMLGLAQGLPVGKRFDAIIIDEAQDFADEWWPVLLAALKDDETGGLYVFSDEGQRVFARFGQPPVALVTLMLDQNLRNTRQIAETFNSLAPMRMKLFGGDGPSVRFVECSTDDAMDAGDDAVEALVDEGWAFSDIALLTTGSRHIEQSQRQDEGQDAYWESFWDDDQVFYGHVLGFKGLERRAVVLVLNETTLGDRSRERLYVGLSRARDQLVVCGDPDVVRQLGGEDVLRHLRDE